MTVVSTDIKKKNLVMVSDFVLDLYHKQWPSFTRDQAKIEVNLNENCVKFLMYFLFIIFFSCEAC